MFRSLICCVFVLGFHVSVLAQQQNVDLLAVVEPQRSVVAGEWTREDETLRVEADRFAICVVPYEVDGSYTVSFEFTRLAGDQTVGLILPLGKSQVLLELSGWNGQAHGFSRVNQAPINSDKNTASVKPGVLKNGVRYRATASVIRVDESVRFGLELNDEVIIDWSGKMSEVEPNLFGQISNNKRFALLAHESPVTFHSLAVRHEEGAGRSIQLDMPAMTAAKSEANQNAEAVFADASVQAVPAEGGAVDLTDVRYRDVFNCDLNVADFEGENVVLLKSKRAADDGALALLPESALGDGEIEVDIAADTFSGIAFRAVDTSNYELLYFRPQNSGTAKHENTVQYVSKGVAGADWRSLREAFPGKYEAGADVASNAWFHARLVIDGDELSVYVDGSKEPVLVVDELLSDRSEGAYGIWGWNSRFKNFTFHPAR